MIKGSVQGQELLIGSPVIAADTINYLTAEFKFRTPDWDGLTKVVHFSNGEKSADIELIDDRVPSSAGLNLSEGVWDVSLTGHAYEGGELVQRITTVIAKLRVRPSAVRDGEPIESLPSYGEEILSKVQGIEQECSELSEKVQGIEQECSELSEKVKDDCTALSEKVETIKESMITSNELTNIKIVRLSNDDCKSFSVDSSVKKCGVNLMPISVAVTPDVEHEINGLVYTINSNDGSITVRGTATKLTTIYINQNTNLPEGVYTLSGCPVGGSELTYRLTCDRWYDDATHTWLTDDGAGDTKPLTGTIDHIRCFFRVYSGVTLDVTVLPMLEYGEQVSSFEKCNEETVDANTETAINGDTTVYSTTSFDMTLYQNAWDKKSNVEETYKTHRALIISNTRNSGSLMPIEDLNRHGYGVEVTSYGNFARNYSAWMKDYDLLVINNDRPRSSVPHWETATLAQIVNAISAWMDGGKKVIYYVFANYNSLSRIADDGTFETQSLDALFPVTLTYKSGIPSDAAFSIAQSCPRELVNCINTEYNNLSGVGFALSGTDIVNVVDFSYSGITYHGCAVKPSKYAIVSAVGSGSKESALCRYVDIGALADYLIGDSDCKIAQDLIGGARILSFGIDGDVTTNFAANDIFIKAFNNRAMEIGLRTNLLTNDLAETYRNAVGSVRYVSHGNAHAANPITNYVQTVTIPANQIVFLDYYCFSSNAYNMTSVKSSDDTMTFTAQNAGTALSSGKYILDRDAGTLQFASADVGIEITIIYTPIDEGKDWIPSIPKLHDYNLQCEDAAYLTSAETSLSGQSYQQMVNRGYIFSDHIDQLPRCSHLLARSAVDRVVPFTRPTFINHITRDGYDGIVYGTTREDAVSNVIRNVWDYATAHNEPIMWYSHDFTTDNGNTKCLYGGTRFNADWSRSTYEASMIYLDVFFQSLIYYFERQASKWITRSEFSRRYYNLQKNIKYYTNKNSVIIENAGDNLIEGLTVRWNVRTEPLSVTSKDGHKVEWTYSNGVLVLWFDLAPGSTEEIILT